MAILGWPVLSVSTLAKKRVARSGFDEVIQLNFMNGCRQYLKPLQVPKVKPSIR
jgi:hypothetical protein